MRVANKLRAWATCTAPKTRRSGGGARVWDTRKTTPGLRALEKAAVRAGGGRNHRGNLSDWVMIKDNHIAAVGGDVAEAIRRATAQAEQQAAAQEQTIADKMSNFKKAFSVCLEGKNYLVKY